MMKIVRSNQLVIPILLIFIFACSIPGISPTVTDTPETRATETINIPAHSPDTIFYNGIILTMDDNKPHAQAIAIDDEYILAVGTNDEILALTDPSTQVIDLLGKTVVPGFIDSHQHRIGDRGKRNYIEADPVIQIAIEQGWTTLDELFVNEERLNELRALDQEDRLRLRVNAYLPVMDNSAEGRLMEPYYEAYSQGQMVSPRVRVAGLKVFTDFDNAKILFWEQDDLNAFLLNLHQQGWQLAIKTVSTRSLEMILKAFEHIETSNPDAINARGRLEHVLFLTPGQIARVKRLGLIPSIQTNMPGEFAGDSTMTELVGREPKGSAFPWRSLAKANIIFANGSAWPSYYVDEPTGAPFGSPIRLIYQAVTRAGNLGAQPQEWMLDQTINAEQALHSLTINAAYANFQDQILGSLTVGKLADMVILSDNPLRVETIDINNIKVLITMISGKVEYCAAGAEAFCPSTSLSSTNAISIGFIDIPVPNETISGTIEIAGWALDEIKIDKVEIYLDGQFIGSATYGNPRPDVERDYPGRPGTPNFGFIFNLNTASYSNGPHTIEALAINSSGNKSPLTPKELTVTINN